MAPLPQYPLTSSNNIIPLFWNSYEESMNAGMLNAVAMYSPSDKELETYHFLGASSPMRQWIGGRQPQGFRQNNFTVENLHFEASVPIKVKDMRREKYGQIRAQISELGLNAAGHGEKLLSELIATGETALCYDGKAFFATDHEEGESGAQSNIVTVDISAIGIPTDEQGSTSDPTPQVMAAAIHKAIERIYSFKNDKGEPINQSAMEFGVHVPVSLMRSASAAINNDAFAANRDNTLKSSGFKVNLHVDPRSAWTTKFAVYVEDSYIKPFIHQEEMETKLDVVAEGSEHEFKHDEHLYGAQRIHNVAFGDWRRSCLVSLT